LLSRIIQCEGPMSKRLRSRPIDFCLEENGGLLECSHHRAAMAQVAKIIETAQQATSVSALYDAYSSDKHSVSLFPGPVESRRGAVV
jgi:hypothetical protein